MLYAPEANQKSQDHPKRLDVFGLLYHRARTLCRFGRIPLALLILYLTGPLGYVFGQGAAGYTKANAAPITATTYTFAAGTFTPGQAYSFEITGLNSAGAESLPSSIVTALDPVGGKGGGSISWTAGTNDATFNVYYEQVAPANPPSAPQVTLN